MKVLMEICWGFFPTLLYVSMLATPIAKMGAYLEKVQGTQTPDFSVDEGEDFSVFSSKIFLDNLLDS